MVGVGGTWNQFGKQVRGHLRLSCWGKLWLQQGLGGQGGVLAPWAPCPGLPGDRNMQRWCLAPSRGNLWGAELLFGLSSQLISPGPQLIPWSTIAAAGLGHCCCAFATFQTPVGFHSACKRGFLDPIWGHRPLVTLSFWRETEKHRWKISKKTIEQISFQKLLSPVCFNRKQLARKIYKSSSAPLKLFIYASPVVK